MRFGWFLSMALRKLIWLMAAIPLSGPEWYSCKTLQHFWGIKKTSSAAVQLLGHGHHWLLAVSTPMNSCSSLVARWTGSWHHKFAQLPRNGMRSRLAALAGTDSALVRESVEFQLQWHCCTHVPRGTLSADGAECKLASWQGIHS